MEITKYPSPVLIASTALLFACNNGGSSVGASSPVDVWEAQINLVSDGCELVPVDQPGFSEEHIITNDGSIYSLTASSGLTDTLTGVYVGSILSFESSQIADIFGINVDCAITSNVKYSDITETDATITFAFSLDCGEIFSCSSGGIGQSIRK